MVVIALKRYELVDTDPDDGREERVLFTFNCRAGAIEQFAKDLDDTFITDRYEVREAHEKCVHDWRCVAVLRGGGAVAKKTERTYVEQCDRCNVYREVDHDNVTYLGDEDTSDLEAVDRVGHRGSVEVDPEDLGTGIDTDDTLPGSNGPGAFGSDLIETPTSGRLTLNPKVSGVARVPLCPDCEEPIERVEHPNALVEYRCGCEDLRYFEFPERDGDTA